MIDVKELRKNYDDVVALSDVSFSISAGEVIGLLGPNGAGKTTLMKILTGFIHPSSGTASIGGFDVLNDTEKVQEMIGYLPENAPIYPELTVQSYLKMIAELRNIPANKQRDRIGEAAIAVGLVDRLTKPIGTLSKGYRQRVGLAQAILHQPKLLILDEPTNGLDPTQIVEVRRLIRSLSKNSTVMVSTHILSEVEATCDRALIIIRGELKADAKLSEISATAQALLTVGRSEKESEIKTSLEGISGVVRVDRDERSDAVMFRVRGSGDGQDLCPQIFTLAKAHDWPLHELRHETKTLESVFNELTATVGGGR
ncbi:MAG: ATP-binding cassette domain-containing protein [Desulfobulbaceae bacterium]|nr:ATP-binding cassette domain-containing protein [Desulfobulbaceae bacterium]